MMCPLCRLAMPGGPGRYVAATAGAAFVFSICGSCDRRLARLPVAIQRKQMTIAADRVAADPERFDARVFPGQTEAHLFCKLASEFPDQAG